MRKGGKGGASWKKKDHIQLSKGVKWAHLWIEENLGILWQRKEVWEKGKLGLGWLGTRKGVTGRSDIEMSCRPGTEGPQAFVVSWPRQVFCMSGLCISGPSAWNALPRNMAWLRSLFIQVSAHTLPYQRELWPPHRKQHLSIPLFIVFLGFTFLHEI